MTCNVFEIFKDREKFETFFRLPRKLANLNGKYFSSIEKQFFNQTQELGGRNSFAILLLILNISLGGPDLF